jgi:tellurite resistance protein TerC
MIPLLAEAAPLVVPTWFWEAFIGGVVVLLFLDAAVFHKHAHEVSTKEAVGWSVFWVALSLAFNGWVWHEFGEGPAKQFFLAFILEKSLSVDNLFVFLLVFQYFKVPAELQHRVLFLGVLGAIVMRFIFIMVGIALIQAFTWMNWVFGAFLLLTAAKMLFGGDAHKDPTQGRAVRLLQRFLPFTPEYHGTKLTVKRDDGRRVATMLLLVVLVIELTDVAFAVDSIPAVIGISTDSFIVFTSNICAILGLRSLYFVLAKFMGAFRYLQPALALILAFIGVKLMHFFHIDDTVSLAIIGGVLLIATVASLLHPKKDEEHPPAPPPAA